MLLISSRRRFSETCLVDLRASNREWLSVTQINGGVFSSAFPVVSSEKRVVRKMALSIPSDRARVSPARVLRESPLQI